MLDERRRTLSWRAVSLIASGALALAGCGGGGGSGGTSNSGNTTPPPTHSLGGTVSGLVGSGLVLSDSSAGRIAISANGAFTFPNHLSAGAGYSVTIESQPATPPQSCQVSQASGTVASADVTNIAIACVAGNAEAMTSRLLDFASSDIHSVTPDTARHRIYLAAPVRNEVIVVDADTYLVVDRYFVGSAPKAMTLSADGSRLYVGLNQGGALVVVDLNTQTQTRIPVTEQLGTPIVQCLTEVRSGVVLLGGSAVGSVSVRLVTVDVANGGAIQVVGSGSAFTAVSAVIRSPDGKSVFGLGTSFGGSAQPSPVLFRLDATQMNLPMTTSAPVDSTVENLVVSQDGTHLISNGTSIYDAATLQRVSPGSANGTIGTTADASILMQSGGATRMRQLDPNSFAELADYTNDCPAGQLHAMVPAQVRGEWLLAIGSSICVVSTQNPTAAPGSAGDRALPPWLPDATVFDWLELGDGRLNDAKIDGPRGVAYAANGSNQSVDVYSIADRQFIASVSLPGKPQVVAISADDSTLYAGLFDTGVVVAIDLPSLQITQQVPLSALLGTPGIFTITELGPGHIWVSSIPGNGGIGPNTYLVDVVMSDPDSAHRVGCALGYPGVAPVLSPDRHFAYLLSATSCPPEKRDLTQAGYPVVRSGPAGGYITGNGQPAILSDGAHLISGGLVIDTSTLQQVANTAIKGIALASSNPDRFYLVDTQSVYTVRLHDLRVLRVAQNGCISTSVTVDNATLSADETVAISIGQGGALCVTQIAPNDL